MFGKILRQLRKERGLTQAELAAILNLDASSISKYEKADVSPSADVLLKVAQYFDVSTDFLLGLSKQKNTPTSNKAGVEAKWDEIQKLIADAPPEKVEEALKILRVLLPPSEHKE